MDALAERTLDRLGDMHLEYSRLLGLYRGVVPLGPDPDFKEGEDLICVDDEGFDLLPGRVYEAAEDSYEQDGEKFVELVANESTEPGFHFHTRQFSKRHLRTQ